MLVVGNTDPLFVKRALVSVHLQFSLTCDFCWNIFIPGSLSGVHNGRNFIIDLLLLITIH